MKSLLIAAAIAVPLAAPAERALCYHPAPDGYIVCHNGDNRYTRALYGGHSQFRLETSDRPIFAAFHKKENRNINFTLFSGSKALRLDSVADCISQYRCGERRYELSDPAWGNGRLVMTAMACFDRDGAVWSIESFDMPEDASLTADCCATVKVKISRNGDIGADPKDCFAPAPEVSPLQSASLNAGGTRHAGYFLYDDRNISAGKSAGLANVFDNTRKQCELLATRIIIDTPDPYINMLGSTLSAAADGIWDGLTWQHGAIGWRMPLSGWRGAYAGDFLGWHDRARTHFDAYALSQVTDVPPVIAHPSQDSTLRLARAEKRWGTQMYSNGYICRNPGRNNQMHHYDMNLCYIDELMRHLAWTGDTAYARKMWPVITAHLDWEKRNFDPDNDGLYDAYCCIWASDALYYSGGAVTHSSAYNYFANSSAAVIAGKIGVDPTPYLNEASHILSAINSTLWMPERGVWAEYRENLGHRRLHDHPALWSIYHAIDSRTASPFQAYSATRYIDRMIPHIPVAAPGIDGDYATLSTTDWLPYAWSINNVAFAEVYHTALAYWLAGRPDDGFAIMKSAMLDGMFLGSSPGNIGQISYYDAARGECYRDFADPVGVLSRTVIEGLFGFSPDAMNGHLNITPGFPSDWNHASITHPDFIMKFKREKNVSHYSLDIASPIFKEITFTLPAAFSKIESVCANGIPVGWHFVKESVGRPLISLTLPATADKPIDIIVKCSGEPVDMEKATATGIKNCGFEEVGQGEAKWWREIPHDDSYAVNTSGFGLTMLNNAESDYSPIDLSRHFNSSITDIFRNDYLSPRPATTTLQIPLNGIGEWCHPLDSADIDDSGLRAKALKGRFVTPQGIPFKLSSDNDNVIYTSLFDNYPDSVSIPLSGRGDAIALLLVGSTNHMQCHIDNARLTVTYTDGSTDTLPLRPPYNWCPVEQDYYIDGKAFRVDTPRPLRVLLKDGAVTDNPGELLGITGVYGRRIEGGAGVVLCMPIDSAKELCRMTLTALSPDIVAGLVAATCIRNN